MATLKSHIETLAQKAANATEAHHAMNFAQAALNLAHAAANMNGANLLNTIAPKRS